jgi:hypothetical protein
MAVRGRLCVDLRIDVMRAAELVLRGAEERLAPIVMTALVRGLALVPIVVGAGRSAPGSGSPDAGGHPPRAVHVHGAESVPSPELTARP